MKNKAIALAVLQKSCQITKKFWDQGKTCALGGLALKAGLTEEQLQQPDCNVLSILNEYFRLTSDNTQEIVKINDGVVNSTPERRRRVMKYVRSLPDEDLFVPVAPVPVPEPMTKTVTEPMPVCDRPEDLVCDTTLSLEVS